MKRNISCLVATILFLASCSPIQTVSTFTAFSTPTVSTLGIGSTTISDKDGMTLLYVPAGEFTMGSKIWEEEEPVHTVNLDAFWIDQTEVTNKMYGLCVSDGVCLYPIRTSSETHDAYYGDVQFDNYPVIYINWHMAKAYCQWAGRRLPTEAEWEKAARGTDERTYPWGNQIDRTFANYHSFIGDTTPVGSYESGKSPYGAYDMAGNVWEWTSSLYQIYPYNATDGREDLNVSGDRMLRGGSWHLESIFVRSAVRLALRVPGPSDILSDNDFGFRCAMSS
jgi:serine/threonine-protein kinase